MISSATVAGPRPAAGRARSPGRAARPGPASRWGSAAARPAPPPPTAPCTPAAGPPRARAPPRPARRRPVRVTVRRRSRDHVAGQPLVAGGVLADDHRGLRHPRAGGQHRLDLARLDPEPADLDLVIGPPGEHQLPRPAVHLARSPVRYIRSPPAPNGHATNRSAVSPARPRYPRASPAPAMYSSPATPAGTGHSHRSSTNTRVLAIGAPIGGASAAAIGMPRRSTSTDGLRRAVQVHAAPAPNRAANRPASQPGSASPRRSPGAGWRTVPAPAWPTNASSIDGTKCTVVIPAAADQPRTGTPDPADRRDGASTSARPPAAASNSSHTDTSKLTEANCSTRSPAPQPVPRLHPAPAGSRSRHAAPPPLRRPGRPRGVDHVRRVAAGSDAARSPSPGHRPPAGQLRGHGPAHRPPAPAPRSRRQPAASSAGGQHAAGTGIGQHERDPLRPGSPGPPAGTPPRPSAPPAAPPPAPADRSISTATTDSGPAPAPPAAAPAGSPARPAPRKSPTRPRTHTATASGTRAARAANSSGTVAGRHRRRGVVPARQHLRPLVAASSTCTWRSRDARVGGDRGQHPGQPLRDQPARSPRRTGPPRPSARRAARRRAVVPSRASARVMSRSNRAAPGPGRHSGRRPQPGQLQRRPGRCSAR